MGFTQLYTLLKTLGRPVAYDHFKAETSPALPFIAYRDAGKDTFMADNIVYVTNGNARIDLYTAAKDIELENQLEDLLTAAELVWADNGELFIESEQIYEHSYFVFL